ncbi:MAG TPA: response regulator, partial [Microvirga sp.]|nr:response regulator [Microvirga sp.]
IWAVDDNKADLDLLEVMLEQVDVSLRTFLSSREAIDVLLATGQADLPDLLLLDVNMPGLDGVEFLRLIRTEPRMADLRIYVVTGAELPAEHLVLRSLGALSILRKPQNFGQIEELRRKVRAALDGSMPAAQMLLSRSG